MKEKLKLTEVKFKLALFVLFILLYIFAIPYPGKSKQFPQLIAVFSLILLMISLIVDFTRKEPVAKVVADVDDNELKVLDDKAKRTKRKRFYRAWEIILVSTAVGFLGGFLFSTFFLFVGFALFFGKRARKNIIKNIVIAVFMSIIIYLSFQWIMKVPLLTGILWDFS